ncbi:MAG: hypothetical protein R2724_24485 [Bryobacterales bacterium]
MPRRLLALPVAAAGSWPKQPIGARFILFLYTDDHSYRTVGAYPQSYPWVETPTMDRLAKEGVRFGTPISARGVCRRARRC